MTNICQRVKREFGSELQVIREKTNGSHKEHGFAICLNGGGAEASKIVEGNNQSVLIPGCVGESAALIHSHPHSPEMEKRLGPMVRQYTGHPSALDLLPHPSIPYACVVSDRFLVCHGKSKGSMKAIKKLMVSEQKSNVAFNSWMLGGLSDRQFRKTMRHTINAQTTAMKATGFFCTAKL